MTRPPDVPRDVPLDRVCIVMLSAIGDSVHVLPVVAALRRHRPDVHVTWLVQRGPLRLLQGHPAVDEFIEVAPTVAGLRDLRRRLADRAFDLALDLQVAFKAGVATALVPAAVKLGFDRARARDLNWLFTTHRIPPHTPQHVQDQYLEFLHALGVPVDAVEWNLGPWPDERAAQRELVAQFDRPIATLVVGTTHPEKEWIAERWAAVSDALVERHGLQPVLAGGRTERELATERAIVAHARHTPASTLGVPLRDLVGLLDASALVVSLDTAPLHMAVALDRPVISLMGYNNPKRVGPYRRFHDLIVDAYGDPGEDYPITPAHRVGRMPRITVTDVLERVERWDARYRERGSAVDPPSSRS